MKSLNCANLKGKNVDGYAFHILFMHEKLVCHSMLQFASDYRSASEKNCLHRESALLSDKNSSENSLILLKGESVKLDSISGVVACYFCLHNPIVAARRPEPVTRITRVFTLLYISHKLL